MKTVSILFIVILAVVFTMGAVYTPQTTPTQDVVVVPDKEALTDYFFELTLEHYEPHPDYTLPQESILTDGKPSDCQDRAYSLAWKATQLGYKDVKLLHMPDHIACLINGRVWDPTSMNKNHDYVFYDYPLEDYKTAFKIHGYWINDYKDKEEE